MQTLTLKIEDAYYSKVVEFIQSLPKKAVKMEAQKMSKAQKQVARDLEAYKKGELKTFDMDEKFWDNIDAIIEEASRNNESKASRKI